MQLQTNDQIADTSNLTIHSSGVLDLLGHTDTINSITFTDGNAGVFTEAGSLGILGGVTALAGFATTPIVGNLNLTGGSRSCLAGPNTRRPPRARFLHPTCTHMARAARCAAR